MDRREFLYTASGAAVVSTSGCLGIGGGGGDGSAGDGNESTGDGEESTDDSESMDDSEATDDGESMDDGEATDDGETTDDGEATDDGEEEVGDGEEEEGDGEEEQNNSVDAIVGQVIRSSEMELVVESFERGTNLEGFRDPERNFEFVDLVVAFRNRSDGFVTVDSFFETVIRDDSGNEYEQEVLKQQPSFNFGTYAPGELDRATLTYEIPQDAQDVELFWEPTGGTYGDLESVTIDLNEERELEQWTMDLRTDINDLGTSVEDGDFRMVVHDFRAVDSIARGAPSPAINNEYIVVDIEFENLSSAQTPIVDERLLAFTTKGENGRSVPYDEGTSAFLQNQVDLRNPLEAGETRRGEIVYERRADMAPLYYAFDFSFYADGDKSFWQLR